MKRLENLKDYVKISCKHCGSDNVFLFVRDCAQCGAQVESRCEDCKSSFCYHNFKRSNEEEF